MYYENELRLLCTTLKKCRLNISFLTEKDSICNILEEAIVHIFENYKTMNVGNFLGKINPNTIYKLTNSAELCYVFFQLPSTSPEQILIIGPYLTNSPTPQKLLEIGKRFSVTPKKQRLLQEYYLGLPVIQDNSRIFIMLEAFGEQIWGGENNFSIVDVNKEIVSDNHVAQKFGANEDSEILMADMELMQKRYNFENELMNAVALGQEHKVAQLSELINEMSFERRMTDPLRNIKNYSIIMNTLLRKAAERGGVHPLYINDISTSFALKIEQSTSVKIAQQLMVEMFSSYCRLVRKHSMKNYSTVVKRVIALINSDLSANLTLSTLAKSQNISSGYLSAIFRKDTGSTVTEYITRQRMQLAIRLLTTTHLQVQTVALHCGIMDVQYFSKLFKKYTGKTPKDYRSTAMQ